ncbi:Putative serine/threonine-protein kinase/receptor [Seminavis robusta]|uniref:Serine/threonine-protein kinase/receptor n=1 Tax=Seminavis robusta TaxID=568900 RepID=A0A9N8ER84_9STRA|nr:Putative serine/threonine-protein kinase/receptor [Seminavis robusta]|eukprot:Sro1853_g301790.1 Putative serine/threonine-protein kinase/receptor (1103) ;mRNA; f:9027-12431
MGASNSKLEDLSVEDICEYVTQLGSKYKSYGEAINSNALDGEILASMELDEEMKETMECLEITNFLHQRVLLKKWRKAKEVTGENAPEGKSLPSAAGVKPELARSSTTFSAQTDASEITLDTAMSTAVSSSNYTRRMEDQQDEDERYWGPPCPPAPVPVGLVVSVEQQQLVDTFSLPKSEDLLPADSQDLHPFRRIAEQCLGDMRSSVAEVNLLDTTHFEDKSGMNNLAVVWPGQETPVRMHFDKPGDWDACRRFILGSDEDFYMEDCAKEIAQELGFKEPARYYGYVVRQNGVRVGTVCTVVELTKSEETSHQEKVDILKFCATAAERQIERRRVLLERTQHLAQGIDQLKKSGVDQVVEPPFGPVKAVMASHLADRDTLFPYPTEPETHQPYNGSPTLPHFSRRSAHMPSYSNALQADAAQRMHLSYSTSQVDPIAKNDMQRTAQMNSMKLMQMDPLSEEAKVIQKLVDMTGALFGAEYAFVSFLDHQHFYELFPTFPQGEKAVSAKFRSFLNDTCEPLRRHPMTGETFVYRASRSGALCNYTVMDPSPQHQCFVVHDVARDESLVYQKEQYDIGFYSGAPIIVRGHAVAGLCMVAMQAKRNFSRSQEAQQEHLARLIGQQLETWALGQEVRKLENHRSLLLTDNTQSQALSRMPSNRPEGHAALVFTSVEGVDALRICNGLERALLLHDHVVRSKLVENGGYEVMREADGSFQLAFMDVVDAVNFALQTQEALFQAPWDEDILAQPEARADCSKSFRGLRVKMAVHSGDVELACEALSGRVSYTGETFHIGKCLGSMGHGGQILVTSDVWDIASHLVSSTLGSPQVLDLGCHVMASGSSDIHDGVTIQNIIQLVPSSLAHDYVENRRLLTGERCAAATVGRVFPAIKTTKAVSASFHDAPCSSNNISIVSVNTSEVQAIADDSSLVLAALSKTIDTVLKENFEGGYQCKDFLVAFHAVSDAVRFALKIQDKLEKENVLDVCLKNKVRIGIQEGVFESMGPNPVTGRAEYFGAVSQYASLVAEAASPGCVYLGKAGSDLDAFLQPVTSGFMLDFTGRRSFQGVDEEFILYKCQPCRSWYDSMMDKRAGRRSLQAPWRDYY